MKFIFAFIIGGVFCLIAQILIDKTKLSPARILVLYVVMGVILGAIGVYKPLVELAGCGALTPLTGFGYLISEGVKKSIDQNGFIGVFSGPLTAAASGTAAALCFGFVASLIFKSRPRK